MKRLKIALAVIGVGMVMGCTILGPDRGRIPDTDPIRPPSLTNEWNSTTNGLIVVEYDIASR